MADPNFEAAVAMLNAAPSEPAPATDAPVEPATAPTPDAPAEAAPAPAPEPVAPTPVVDDDDKLIADLDARKHARLSKHAPDIVAQLQAENAELKARLHAPPQADEAAVAQRHARELVRKHGYLEATRMLGFEPQDFYEGWKKDAKAQNPAAKAEREAAEARRIAEENDQRLTAREQAEQQRYEAHVKAQSEATFLGVVKDPSLNLRFIPKMDPAQLIERTYAKIDELRMGGHDLAAVTDGELARLIERDVRAEIQRLTGTDPGATTNTTTVPATDGAKPRPDVPAAASLTNDLAAQSTGRRELTSDKERFAAAVRILQTGPQE